MRDKGIVRGVIVPFLLCGAVFFILYNSSFSIGYEFKGKESLKSWWDKGGIPV